MDRSLVRDDDAGEDLRKALTCPHRFCPLLPGVSPFFTSKEMVPGAKKILMILLSVDDFLRAGRPASGKA